MRIVYGGAGLLAFVAGVYALSSKSSQDNGSESESRSATAIPTTMTASSGSSVQHGGSAEISVRVVYFGMPLAATGTKKETVELTSPAYLSDLKNELVQMHPGLGNMLSSMLFLVDGVSATGNPQLEDNYEVDILALGVGG